MEVLNKEKVLEHAKKLIDEGKLDRAIIEYRKLLDIDPKDMRIKIRIAELFIRQKKVADAIKVYKEVADSYTDDGFYLKAVTVYKNILRLNPSMMDINRALAELYEKMGLNKDAIHQYQILASAMEHRGDYQSLINIRRKMAELDPHNISARIRLAETYQYQGMEENSVNEYELLVDEVKSSGSPEQLVDLYEKILSYRPDNLEMIRAVCRIYYQRGEWKKIVGRLEKARELVAGQTDLLLILADVFARLNQVETAKTKYKDAAEIFLQTGEPHKAVDAYMEILVISPDSAEEIKELLDEIDPLLFEKVKDDADKKRKEIEEREAALAAEREALAEAAEKAAQEAPKPEEEETIDLEPKPLPKKEVSLKLSDKEIKKKLGDASGAFELGKAYMQMGLKSEARPELEKCLTLYRELVEGGYKSDEVTGNLAKIEEWLGGGATGTVDVEKKEAKSNHQPEERKAEAKESVKKEEKKKKDEAKDPKKKKDKRMGFV